MAVQDADIWLEFKQKGPKTELETQKIPVLGWNWHGANPSAHNVLTGGGVSGKVVQLSEVQITTQAISLATCSIFLGMCKGEHYPEVVITNNKKSGDNAIEALKITLKHCTIPSHSLSCHGVHGADVTETFSIAYQSIKFDYKGQKQDGTPDKSNDSGWDLAKHAAV